MNRDGFHRQTISKGRVNYEQHAVEALQFELAKDGVTAVRTRMRSNLVNVHPDLARRAAEVPGVAVPVGRARTPAKRHAPPHLRRACWLAATHAPAAHRSRRLAASHKPVRIVLHGKTLVADSACVTVVSASSLDAALLAATRRIATP